MTKNNPSDSPTRSGSAAKAQHAHESNPNGDESWKTKAPYRVHDDADNFDIMHKGSCHCGRVTYNLSRDKPLAAKYCHCTTCQTIHGAPFQWAAIFEKTDINFTNGVHGLEWYQSSEKTSKHTLPCKVRCGYCGTWIMDEGRNMILLFPTLIHFKSTEDREKFAPTCHMFYAQRVVDIPDGKVKWTGIDGKSEQIDEEHLHGKAAEELKQNAAKNNEVGDGQQDEQQDEQQNGKRKRVKAEGNASL